MSLFFKTFFASEKKLLASLARIKFILQKVPSARPVKLLQCKTVTFHEIFFHKVGEILTFTEKKHKSLHCGSYKPDKLRGTQHKGRNSAVQSSQLSWTGQYKKCVQYNLKSTVVYSHETLAILMRAQYF